MVKVTFYTSEQGFARVWVSGHANFAPGGEDIVCSGVSSAVMLTANGITEILGEAAEIQVLENEVGIHLPAQPSPAAVAFMQALHLHLTLLQQQYPKHITVTEV
ncbi:MAG: ribosomal-processing cysteine protease Prp [Oscillospiraceae bacterium]|nr:ribosomal-processing cysteine protease Prp [Oscillospiraceae bacterium]